MISLELTRLHVALVLYIIFVMIILLVRPAFMFTHDGRLKKWGMENNEDTNMFAFGFVAIIMAIVVYIMATWIDVALYKP